MLNIGVLVSGGGTNLQALIDAVEAGKINGKIVTVISNKEDVFALERAKKHNIDATVIKKSGNNNFDDELLSHLKKMNVDIIVLAGFLCIISSKIISEYRNKIINVHPSLIPSFCGEGYYGLKVHQKALEYGVKVTGATVHFVNEVVDGGAIILQKAVDILEGDTPETLQKRVMEQAEWDILPRAVALLCDGKI